MTAVDRSERAELRVEIPGGQLGGWVSGEGDPVLLLHGGPGLGYEYLDPLAAELGGEFRIAAFQQRGLPPSTERGPFTVAQAIEDVITVLDALGVAGDGGTAGFIAEMAARTPPQARREGAALDARLEAGTGTAQDALDSLRLLWPAYFADPAAAPPRAAFVVGAGSPLPWGQASQASAESIAGAVVHVVPGAGHFPWMEVPGCVREALQQLSRRSRQRE
jgi:pimeloyl-ACP methyl ester carboxylesterase